LLLRIKVSVGEVRRDIQEALGEGWNNPDPGVQEYWRKIPSRYEKPTLEEVIDFIVKENKLRFKK
jgi:hypothetical protein